MFGKHIAGAVRHMFAACLLMLAWGAMAHAAPPLPDGIVPADGSTTAPLGTLLQWRTPPTSTTLTPVYVPKILIFNPVGTSLNVTESLNKYFTRYNSTETKSTDPNTIRTLLADKQVFLMPPQYYLGTSGYTTWSQLVTFGTTIGPICASSCRGAAW